MAAGRQFRIGPRVGRGGYGEVYRATTHGPGALVQSVAVKVLTASPGPSAVERLRDEARMLAWLGHPALLRVQDLVELDGRIALVAEYVDGVDLSAAVRGDHPLPARAAVEVIGAAAAALQVAHETAGPEGKPLKLVHRDIKPSNLRIARDGYAKLLDFGIATADDPSREARTRTGVMVGSPHYMAPERFLDAPLGPAVDVFGLGCCLYEALASGERFHGNRAMMEISVVSLDAEPYARHLDARLRVLPPTTPAPLLALLREMLAYEPADRPPIADVASRCADLAPQLPGATLARWCRDRAWKPDPGETGELSGRELRGGEPSSGPPAPGSQASAALEAPAPRRRRWWIALLVIFLILAIVALATGGAGLLVTALGVALLSGS